MHLILFPLGEMKKCRLNLRAGLELPPITVPEEADLIGLVETKVRSGKEKLYRGLSQAVTVAVWERQDSNLRRKTSTDLQSVAFDHSATLPFPGRGPPQWVLRRRAAP